MKPCLIFHNSFLFVCLGFFLLLFVCLSWKLGGSKFFLACFRQLVQLCEWLKSTHIVYHIAPLALGLCQDKVADVRTKAFTLVSCYTSVSFRLSGRCRASHQAKMMEGRVAKDFFLVQAGLVSVCVRVWVGGCE